MCLIISSPSKFTIVRASNMNISPQFCMFVGRKCTHTHLHTHDQCYIYSCIECYGYASMGYCKKDITPLLTHWSYVFSTNPSVCHEMLYVSHDEVCKLSWVTFSQSYLPNESVTCITNISLFAFQKSMIVFCFHSVRITSKLTHCNYSRDTYF